MSLLCCCGYDFIFHTWTWTHFYRVLWFQIRSWAVSMFRILGYHMFPRVISPIYTCFSTCICVSTVLRIIIVIFFYIHMHTYNWVDSLIWIRFKILPVVIGRYDKVHALRELIERLRSHRLLVYWRLMHRVNDFDRWRIKQTYLLTTK